MRNHHTHSWERHIRKYIGKPVGIAFDDGRGTSGILCDADGKELWVYEYLYRDQFALKHYGYGGIQDIHAFPSCRSRRRREPVVY